MDIAVCHIGTRIDYDTGEVLPDFYLLTEWNERVSNIPEFVRTAEPTVFITTDPAELLKRLTDAFPSNEFVFTLTRVKREAGDTLLSRTTLKSFGLRVKGERSQRRHQCWNPRTISPTPARNFIDEPTHEALLAWGLDVRSWAEVNNLDLRNAFAGYASQLLRDERFYPDTRRKVPKATNEKARPSLPGNLLALFTSPGPTTYNVTSIDQNRAHHRIVQEIDLPDANTLFARGHFNRLEDAPYWAERGSEAYDKLISTCGLLYVGMHSTPTTPKNPFRMRVQDYSGFARKFVYTNTIQYLESHGSHIDGIYAAWTSITSDSGLSRYAAFAEHEVTTASPHRKKWLKPLLLSTYGLLAARPRALEVGHYGGTGGEPTTFYLGVREFDVRMTTLKEWQPAITNVIQRGMIEAETQIRSLAMAEYLTQAGCRVLAIQTDALHVQGQLPMLPDNWSVSQLSGVMYLDRASYVAADKVCLPGRDRREQQEVVKHYANLQSIVANRSKRGGRDSCSQLAEEWTGMEESRTSESIDTINKADGGRSMVGPDTEHVEGNGSGFVDDGLFRLPELTDVLVRVRKRGSSKPRPTAQKPLKSATLRAYQSTALDRLQRAIPYGVYGPTRRGFGMSDVTQDPNVTGESSDDAQDDGLFTLPARKRDGSVTDEQMARFHALVTEGRITAENGMAWAVPTARGQKKEGTARNRARSFALAYEKEYGLKLSSHAAPDATDNTKFMGAVSIRKNQDEDESQSQSTVPTDNTDAANAPSDDNPPSGADAAAQANTEGESTETTSRKRK